MATEMKMNRARTLAKWSALTERHPEGFSISWGLSDNPEVSERIETLANEGLLARNKDDQRLLSLSDAGKRIAPNADLLGVTRHADGSRHSNDTVAALWALVLLKGGARGCSGVSSVYPMGQNGEILHLLDCGINADESVTPDDGSWYEFEGTFADQGDNRTGLVGRAKCMCGEVGGDDEWDRPEIVYSPKGGMAAFLTEIGGIK